MAVSYPRLNLDRTNGNYKILDAKQLRVKFILTENPSDSNILQFLQFFESQRARVYARISIPTFNVTPLVARGIVVYDFMFEQNSNPPPELIARWLTVVRDVYKANNAHTSKHYDSIIVQGVSEGVRGPFLIAIALCELSMDVQDVIEFLRSKIGANSFKPEHLEYLFNRYGHSSKGCCVM